MNYITEIFGGSGRVSSLRYPFWDKGTDIVAIVYDNTGKNYIVKSSTDLSLSLLGSGVDAMLMSGYLVEYNAKTAKFLDYVEKAETIYGEYSEDMRDPVLSNWDTVTLDNNYVSGHAEVSGRRRIIINTSIEAIELCGSVVSRSGSLGVNPKLMTLYDLFGELCRESGLNLLQYHRIILSSVVRSRLTEIRLKHDDEAERFFTKMYMDVIKK